MRIISEFCSYQYGLVVGILVGLSVLSKACFYKSVVLYVYNACVDYEMVNAVYALIVDKAAVFVYIAAQKLHPFGISTAVEVTASEQYVVFDFFLEKVKHFPQDLHKRVE